MNLFQSPIVDHINYDNFALSISNLYAIRPIMWLIAQGMYIQAVSVFFAMVASLLFHLIQYDEHVQFIFTDVAPLSGSIFKGGQLAAPIWRQRLLALDRIAAVTSSAVGCHYLYKKYERHMTTKNLWPLFKTAAASAMAFGVLILSEAVPTKELYVFVHTIWHFTAFQLIYFLYTSDFEWVFDRRRKSEGFKFLKMLFYEPPGARGEQKLNLA